MIGGTWVFVPHSVFFSTAEGFGRASTLNGMKLEENYKIFRYFDRGWV